MRSLFTKTSRQEFAPLFRGKEEDRKMRGREEIKSLKGKKVRM